MSGQLGRHVLIRAGPHWYYQALRGSSWSFYWQWPGCLGHTPLPCPCSTPCSENGSHWALSSRISECSLLHTLAKPSLSLWMPRICRSGRFHRFWGRGLGLFLSCFLDQIGPKVGYVGRLSLLVSPSPPFTDPLYYQVLWFDVLSCKVQFRSVLIWCVSANSSDQLRGPPYLKSADCPTKFHYPCLIAVSFAFSF